MSDRQLFLLKRKHMLLTKLGDLNLGESLWLASIESELAKISYEPVS